MLVERTALGHHAALAVLDLRTEKVKMTLRWRVQQKHRRHYQRIDSYEEAIQSVVSFPEVASNGRQSVGRAS